MSPGESITLHVAAPADLVATPPVADYELRPKVLADGSTEGDLLEISMGPQHPSTHGVFRMDVVLDGERVVKLKPVFGYLHRNHEKIGENTTYLGSMPYTDRLDYFCSLTNNWAYALTVEKLAGLQPPAARRIHPRDHGRVDPAAEPRLARRLPPPGHGRDGHAPDVCLPRAGEDPRPVRVPHRGAHDVQLHALWRLPLRPAARLAGAGQAGGRRLPALPRRVGSPAQRERNPALAHAGRRRAFARTRRQCQHHRPDAPRQRRQLRHSQGGQIRHLRPLRLPRAAGRPRRRL